MIAGALIPITRQMSRSQRRKNCVDAIRYAPSAPPEILDSSVNRVLHALPTGSNLRRFESSIAHRRNLLSTGSTTNTSRTVPSVITVSSKTTMPTGGAAVDGGEYLYFESATTNFGGVRHLSADSSPSAIACQVSRRPRFSSHALLARQIRPSARLRRRSKMRKPKLVSALRKAS
mgnify:CR=1 FL=1